MPAEDLLLALRRGERVTTRVDAPEQVEGELAAGTRVGRVAVLRDGKVVKRVALVTAADVPGAGPLRVISEELGGALITLLLLLGLTVAGWGGIKVQSRRRARHLAERRRERRRARARAES